MRSELLFISFPIHVYRRAARASRNIKWSLPNWTRRIWAESGRIFLNTWPGILSNDFKRSSETVLHKTFSHPKTVWWFLLKAPWILVIPDWLFSHFNVRLSLFLVVILFIISLIVILFSHTKMFGVTSYDKTFWWLRGTYHTNHLGMRKYKYDLEWTMKSLKAK